MTNLKRKFIRLKCLNSLNGQVGTMFLEYGLDHICIFYSAVSNQLYHKAKEYLWEICPIDFRYSFCYVICPYGFSCFWEQTGSYLICSPITHGHRISRRTVYTLVNLFTKGKNYYYLCLQSVEPLAFFS